MGIPIFGNPGGYDPRQPQMFDQKVQRVDPNMGKGDPAMMERNKQSWLAVGNAFGGAAQSMSDAYRTKREREGNPIQPWFGAPPQQAPALPPLSLLDPATGAPLTQTQQMGLALKNPGLGAPPAPAFDIFGGGGGGS